MVLLQLEQMICNPRTLRICHISPIFVLNLHVNLSDLFFLSSETAIGEKKLRNENKIVFSVFLDF